METWTHPKSVGGDGWVQAEGFINTGVEVGKGLEDSSVRVRVRGQFGADLVDV